MLTNDPRKIAARFNSTCSKCKAPIKKGETIIYWPSNRTADHEKCSQEDFSQFILSVQDENFYNSQYGQY